MVNLCNRKATEVASQSSARKFSSLKLPQPLPSEYTLPLHKESKGITIGLCLLNKTSTKVISTCPLTEFPNVLRVQTDSLSPNFVQLIISEGNFCNVNGGREDSEFGLRSHLKTGFASSCNWFGSAWSLGDHKIGSCSIKKGGIIFHELLVRIMM
jgi:hypothetical protein